MEIHDTIMSQRSLYVYGSWCSKSLEYNDGYDIDYYVLRSKLGIECRQKGNTCSMGIGVINMSKNFSLPAMRITVDPIAQELLGKCLYDVMIIMGDIRAGSNGMVLDNGFCKGE